MKTLVRWTLPLALYALVLAGCPTPPTDTYGPTGAITINFDDTYTVTARVTLGILAADAGGASGGSALRMMISNTADFLGADWEAYSVTKAWELPEADGEKTVFARFADGVGSESPVYSDAILLDSTLPGPPPAPDLASEDDSGERDWDNLTNRSTDLTFSGSGVDPAATVRLYNHVTGLIGATEADSSGAWSIDADLSEGTYAVFARVLDAAGNESPSSAAVTVAVDVTAPGVPSILTPAQGRNTGTTRRPVFSWTEAADASSYELQADEAPSFASPGYDWTGLDGTSFTPPADFAASAAAPVGTRYYLRLKAVDAAGNAGEWSNPELPRYVNIGRFDKDFNGDGYSDALAGAVEINKGQGAVYVYFGGSAMDNVADLTMPGLQSLNSFGHSVASAGDMNGDGYADAIVGAPDASSRRGRFTIYLGGSAMDNVADLTVTGDAVGANLGWSVAPAGDVNGDGYDDAIVGAIDSVGGRGRAQIYFGGPAMDDVADVTMTGDAQWAEFGWSVASAGDVNGDGYPDAIVGARAWFNHQGHAFVYFGGPAMDGTADVTMTGGTPGDGLGGSVASAGDVNGDGYADAIVGAAWPVDRPGRAFVYLGGPSMNGIADVTLTGETAGDRFGWSVASAGDTNGDGYADVVVGSPSAYDLFGRSYIYLGGTSLNETADIVATGEAAGDYFGTSAAGPGDVNADGYSDPIVGAPRAVTFSGRAYLFFGGSFADTVPDVILTGAAGSAFGGSVSSVQGKGPPSA
jgi:hypothetical protein